MGAQMSKPKFLPGPWDVDEYVDAIFICTEDNSVIAEVMPKETRSAYLMSASPDLYAALEAAIPFLASHPTDAALSRLIDAESALKKARGET